MLDELWRRYERDVIWRGDQFEEQHPDVVPKLKVEQVHAWEDWACDRLGLGAFLPV